MTDSDDPSRPATTTWTTRWRIPIAVVTAALTLACCWALSSGDPTTMWAGGAGLVVLVAWVFVFRALVRRGY